MKISGIIDFSMNNFLCIRGFAPIKDLYTLSQSIPEIQRSLIDEHKGEMANFLNKGEFTFFPEVILSTVLSEGEDTQKADILFEKIRQKNGLPTTKINDLNISVSLANITKSQVEDRARDIILTANINVDEKNMRKFYRIDGNHRLSAAEESERNYNTPFCLLIFKTKEESSKFNRAIFHNINSKQLPLKLEQNLKVILDGDDIFTDDILINDPSFGYHYYLARKLINNTDLSYFPYINRFISQSKNTYFINLFKYLIEHEIIDKNETAIITVRDQLSEINNSIDQSQIINTTDNIAIIGALSYYKLQSESKYSSFINWIKKNNIGLVENLHIDDVIKIYDNIYENIPKKVFLARWYPPVVEETHHNKANLRLTEIKRMTSILNLELKDLGTETGGTCPIREEMYTSIRESDIFIADLTGLRPNVMVELGYALHFIGKKRVIIIHQTVDTTEEVPFDLNGFRYRQFSDTGEMSSMIKPDLEEIIYQSELAEI